LYVAQNLRERKGRLARDRGPDLDTPDTHSQWFFGTGDMPRWAGYTIGSRWVRDYLAARPDVDVVAATLLPADEIVPR
jgi:uncharacterized protein YjaZ